MTSQRKVRGTQVGRHSLSAFVHAQGHWPGDSVEPQFPSSMTLHVPPSVSPIRDDSTSSRGNSARSLAQAHGQTRRHKKKKTRTCSPNMRSARVTLTQTRGGRLLDHSKERNHEIR